MEGGEKNIYKRRFLLLYVLKSWLLLLNTSSEAKPDLGVHEHH